MTESAQIDKTVVVRRQNPLNWLFVVSTAAWLIMLTFIFSITPLVHFPIIFWSFAFITLLPRLWMVITKVTINPEGIEIRSPTSKRFYSWSEIVVVGMFIRKGRSITTLSSREFNEQILFETKFIWFTKLPGANPEQRLLMNDYYGFFEYTENAWKLVNRYMGTKLEKGTVTLPS